jgi:hypothetical protein
VGPNGKDFDSYLEGTISNIFWDTGYPDFLAQVFLILLSISKQIPEDELKLDQDRFLGIYTVQFNIQL